MKHRTLVKLLAFAAFAWSPGVCHACYSGLLLIPTADLVPKSGYSLEFQLDGRVKRLAADTHYLNTEFGIAENFEAGLDVNMNGEDGPPAFVNAKYVLPVGKRAQVKVAVGVCGFAEHSEETPYAVATADLASMRLHGGVIRISDRERLCIGVDKAVSERVTLMADWTDGSENAASAGFNFALAKNTCITAGFMFPNSGESARFSVHWVVFGP